MCRLNEVHRDSTHMLSVVDYNESIQMPLVYWNYRGDIHVTNQFDHTVPKVYIYIYIIYILYTNLICTIINEGITITKLLC